LEDAAMADWTTADFVILAIVGFIAISSLVRLMLHRRNELVQDLQKQARHAKQSIDENK
jgi:hypothetical protein